MWSDVVEELTDKNLDLLRRLWEVSWSQEVKDALQREDKMSSIGSKNL